MASSLRRLTARVVLALACLLVAAACSSALSSAEADGELPHHAEAPLASTLPSADAGGGEGHGSGHGVSSKKDDGEHGGGHQRSGHGHGDDDDGDGRGQGGNGHGRDKDDDDDERSVRESSGGTSAPAGNRSTQPRRARGDENGGGSGSSGGTAAEPPSSAPQPARPGRDAGRREGGRTRRPASTRARARARVAAARALRDARRDAATAGATADSPTGAAGETAATGGADREPESRRGRRGDGGGDKSSPLREVVPPPIQRIVEVVPPHLQWLILGLGALVLLLLVGSGLGALRASHLRRQRERLLGEVGVLQAALLPRVPERLGGLRASVAYRPADGPGAGGDFYDAFELGDGRTGFLIGDVSGHGRAVLSRTASLRYTLRAYLEAGLEPRAALALGGEVLGRELDTAFATVALAVHDPRAGTLTYATAGHPPPIVLGPAAHEPVVAGSAPPIGAGMPTGLRQTTVDFQPGSVACLFTDGLVEARNGAGLVGREGLARVVDELGEDSDAPAVLARVARDAERLTDDAAVLVLHADSAAANGDAPARVEQLALDSGQLATTDMQRFLWACGVPPLEAQRAIAAARSVSDRFDELILRVSVEDGQAEVAVLGADRATLSAAEPPAPPFEVSARRLALELDA